MMIAFCATETAFGAVPSAGLAGGLPAQPRSSSTYAPAGHDDPADAEALFAGLYSELHRLARRELARRGGHGMLSATTLLHDAYLGISARDGLVFPDRGRFLAYAARTMRGLIIDHIRRRQAHKRGGLLAMTALHTTIAGGITDEHELQYISDALDELTAIDAALAEVVDLKFFGGFSFAEIAAMRDVSERTVQRQWEKARLYLHRQIAGTPSRPADRLAVR